MELYALLGVMIFVTVASVVLVGLEKRDRRKAEAAWTKERGTLIDKLMAKSVSEFFQANAQAPPAMPMPRRPPPLDDLDAGMGALTSSGAPRYE